MTTKGQQKELTHQTILESAARLVRECGIIGARQQAACVSHLS